MHLPLGSRLLALGVLAASLSACGAVSHSPSASTPSSSTARPAASGISKVVVFMVENHSLSEMQTGMPKTYAFAKQHSYATDYSAIRHPSLPNYIAIAAGSTLGIADDADPSAHRLKGTSVLRQAAQHGKTAKVYADAMPHRCTLTNHGEYAVRHNPWPYFVKDRAACRKHDVPAKRLAHDTAAGTLPNVGFVIPDVMHDAHDGTLAQADGWISRQIDTLTAGPDWRSGRLAVVVTADEDDKHHGNKVLTVLATQGQRPKVVSRRLDHYSLSGFLSRVAGAKPLRHARTAPSFAEAFGVKIA